MRTHGWTSIAVWALLGAAYVYRGGFAFGFVFFVYSTLCLYSILIGWMGLRGLKVYRIVYEEGSAEGLRRTLFTAGDEATVRITMRRAFPLPLPWLAVRDQAGEWRHDRICGPWMGRELKLRYVLPLPERGVYRFEDIELWTGDPFGIATSRRRIPMPACEAVAAPKPYIFDSQTERELVARNAEDRYSGHLRAFRDGDPMKHIVWKTVARTDRWMVRTPADDAFIRDTAILVDTWVPEHAGSSKAKAAIDLCAEAAAGVCEALSRHRRTFTIWDGKPAAPSRPWAYKLAVLEESDGAPLTEAARKAVTLGTESVIVISARADGDATSLCRDLKSRGMNVIYMFVGWEPAALKRAHQTLSWIGMSGCRVVELGKNGGTYDDGSQTVYSS